MSERSTERDRGSAAVSGTISIGDHCWFGASVTVAGARLRPSVREAPSVVPRWTGSPLGGLIESDDPAPPAAASVDPGSTRDPAARERVTLALAFSSGERVVPSLIRALGDPHAGVREKAAVGLA